MTYIPKVISYYGEKIVNKWHDHKTDFFNYKTETGRIVGMAASEVAFGKFLDGMIVDTTDEIYGFLPSGSVCVPFNDWFGASGTSSVAAYPQLGKNNCHYCRCRLFETDRFCPACGGPIYE